MDNKHKAYLKLNIISLFFLAVSFISITLAWFAYSGLAKVSTDIDVKTWYVEFQKNGEAVSNNIVISLSEIFPGMETVYESVKIANKGDTDARLSYSIVSASILDDSLSSEENLDLLNDKLSHDYPFKINMNLSKNYISHGGDESMFDLSVSWPFDSGDDESDTLWGQNAYHFQLNENNKASKNPSYNIRPSIKIVISVKAEQMTTTIDNPDIDYALGKTILYDVVSNKSCSELSDTCIRTHVIDTDNTIGDTTVTLLPDLFNNYSSGKYDDFNSLFNSSINGWNVNTRSLTIDDLIKVISGDVTDSIISSDVVSSTLIGYTKYGDRVNYLIDKTINNSGYFSFLNNRFNYLATNKCYWVNREYNSSKAFALTKTDDVSSKIYGVDKNSVCSVVPVIIAPKETLK